MNPTALSDPQPAAEELESRTHSAISWTTWTGMVLLGQRSGLALSSACTSIRLRQLLGTLTSTDLGVLDRPRAEHITGLLTELHSSLSNVLHLAGRQDLTRHFFHRFFLSDLEKNVQHLGTILITSLHSFGGDDPGDPPGWRGLTSRLSPDYERAMNMIKKLERLTPGWDSYDAVGISPQTRQRAIEFLKLLARMRASVPAPIVGPSPDGGVSLQWRTKEYEVEIVVLPKGEEYLVAERGSDRYVAEGSELRPEELARDIVTKYISTR